MDLAVVMRPEVLADKLEDGRGRAVATWNTRRLPTRLTPGWTNRLFVATHGHWRGYFPLSGDVFWNPRDVAAPYALIVDPRRWTPIGPTPCPSFRGWRYLDTPPGGAPEIAPHHDADHTSEAASIPPRPP
jgi:hypothetical protein